MPTQRTKRHQRQSTVEVADAPTTELHMDEVVLAGPCHSHEYTVDVGWPCYHVEGLTGRPIYGVCDNRARKAGFAGEIDPASLSNSRRPYTR